MKIKLNDKIVIDLVKLVVSRLLIQANSGGGKSWAIRRIIEWAFKYIQIIVIDPEGEFGNLRSKFDFVYAGKDGDAPVESRSAALLARRLLELKASAIIDLYELPPQERKHYVRLFLDSMVNAPKELWHDCLVILDEAHVFAPEKDQSESLSAVIDMASRGRKRGYCLIPATQRPAKLNKDVAAECNNKLIGRASLDIDRKRAADELGFTSKEQILSLRDLEPGEFYAFGPAISKDVIKLKIGDVDVKPAQRGVSARSVPAPTAAVKKILGKLADLPQEAAKEAQTVAELKAEIVQLKRNKVEVKSNDADIARAIKKRDAEWAKIVQDWKYWGEGLYEALRRTLAAASWWEEAGNKRPPSEPGKASIEAPKAVQPVSMPGRDSSHHPPLRLPKEPVAPTEGLTGPEQRILDAIALSESIGVQEPEQTAVAFLAGYTYGGGGFNNPRGALKTKGLVEYRGSRIALTEEGRASANVPETPLTGEMLRDKVLSILPGPEQKLLRPLFSAYPEAMSNEDLANASGYTNGSGGFNNPKGRLRTLGLIDYPSSGQSRAKDFLFP